MFHLLSNLPSGLASSLAENRGGKMLKILLVNIVDDHKQQLL